MMEYQFIDPQNIIDMLFDDAKYVIEFCEAGVTSLNEFSEDFEKHLPEKNMEALRKAGHKIKPGAQMMGATEIIDEYEHAKQLLESNAAKQELTDSVEKMNNLCLSVKQELHSLAEDQSE